MPLFSPSLTVSLYADYINGAKLPKKFLPNVHNVKRNEFLIGCCKKKNYFLSSAQPSKNLPSQGNKMQAHCKQWTEDKRPKKVMPRTKSRSLVPPRCPPENWLQRTNPGPDHAGSDLRSPALCLHRVPLPGRDADQQMQVLVWSVPPLALQPSATGLTSLSPDIHLHGAGITVGLRPHL